MNKFQIKIVEKIALTKTVLHLTLEAIGLPEFQFVPGQFVGIEVAEKVKRYYSIASAPKSNKFELIVDTSPGGPGSKFFESLSVGDEAPAFGPLGQMTFKSEGKSVFIATGTGYAPFRAMIMSELEKGNQNEIELLWGFRHEEDIYLKDELDSLSRKYPNFTYKITLSDPSEQWQGEKGRVTAVLENVGIDQSATYYLCGVNAMVNDVKNMLLAQGVQKENIHFEIF